MQQVLLDSRVLKYELLREQNNFDKGQRVP